MTLSYIIRCSLRPAELRGSYIAIEAPRHIMYTFLYSLTHSIILIMILNQSFTSEWTTRLYRIIWLDTRGVYRTSSVLHHSLNGAKGYIRSLPSFRMISSAGYL